MCLEKEISFVCSCQSNRFSNLIDRFESGVEKRGDRVLLWDAGRSLSFQYVWDNNPDIGKKYCLAGSVAELRENARVVKGYVEADPYDIYRACFSACDLFNKEYPLLNICIIF